jgi:hypothetical protein
VKFEIIKVPSSNVSFNRVMVGLRFCATLNIVLINTLDNFLYLGQRSQRNDICKTEMKKELLFLELKYFKM